jgi:hypothetical protein
MSKTDSIADQSRSVGSNDNVRKSSPIFVGLILLFGEVIVWVQSRNGIRIPEEATMLDYSWTIKALFGTEQLREQLAFDSQWTTVVPWGILSTTLNFTGASVVTNFVITQFIRHFTLHLLIYSLLRRFSRPAIAFLLSCCLMCLPPIRLGISYSHWWSHIVLLCGLTCLMLGSDTSERFWRLKVALLVIATISVWTNLPHLITAWLVLPQLFILSLLVNEWSIIRTRLKFVLQAASAIYLLPAATALRSMSNFSGAERNALGFFEANSIFKALQGYGQWWYFAEACFGEHCMKYDLTLFEHFRGMREVVRVLVLVIVIVGIGTIRRTIRRKNEKKGLLPVEALTIVSMLAFALSLLANFSWYQNTLSKLPIAFSAIREPYAKFAPTFLVFLYLALAIILAKLSIKFRRLVTTCLLVVVVYLWIPEFHRNSHDWNTYYSHFGYFSNSEWKLLDRDLKILTDVSDDICVFNSGELENRQILALASLRFPEKFTDLYVLRPLSISDAISSQGKTLDRPSTCSQPDVSILFIGMNTMESAPANYCELKKSKFFLLLVAKC